MTYQATLECVMDAILANDPNQASNLCKEKNNFPPHAQLSVYTEGYRLRLCEVIEHAYPVVTKLIGQSALRNLAMNYIEATPSQHFNIDKYPLGFAAWFECKSNNIFACEVVRLEEAIHAVYQGEESSPLSQEWLRQQTPQSLMEAQLTLRSSAQLLVFTHPVNDYLTLIREEKNPPIPQANNTWLLVFRHRHQVQRLPLEEGEYSILSFLAQGEKLGIALENAASGEEDMEKIPHWLARWTQAGCLRQPL